MRVRARVLPGRTFGERRLTMASKRAGAGLSTAKLVEKQMRNWEIARAQRLETPEARHAGVESFVTISRKLGSGGSEVATALGEKLGWPVFDKGILQTMAGDDAIRRQIYQSMDERDLSWFEQTVRAFMEGAFKKNDYIRNLSRTILSLARQGSGVFVGRAADRILPLDAGLRVRITAPHSLCVKAYAARLGLGEEQAEADWGRVEAERAEFVRNHFKVEATDPARFDLTINRERFTTEQAVEMILLAMRRRGLFSD
jgi:cytidylate kinase